MKNYFVQIIEYENDRVVEIMGPFAEIKAVKVDDGVNINLNHEKYYTIIVEDE